MGTGKGGGEEWGNRFLVTHRAKFLTVQTFLCTYYVVWYILFLLLLIKICSFFFCHRFGCCSDGETPSGGPEGAGCDDARNCTSGPFGCCPDGNTWAQGPKSQGCFKCPEEVR